MRKEFDQFLDAAMSKAMVQHKATMRRTPGGKIVPVKAHMEFHKDGAIRPETAKGNGKRTVQTTGKSQGSKDQTRRIDSSVTDLTIKRHLKEIRATENAIKGARGSALTILKKRLAALNAIVANVKPAKKAPVSTAKKAIKTADKTATKPLKHRAPARKLATSKDAPIPSVRQAARKAAGKGAAVTPNPKPKPGKLTTPAPKPVKHLATKAKAQKGAPAETKDAAKGAGKLKMPSKAMAKDTRVSRRPARITSTPLPIEPKKRDARVELPGEAEGHHRNWFPDKEAHLVALEPKRHEMVRAGEPKSPKAREKFVAERKELETQYLKTWTPMIRHYAKRVIQTLGLNPRIDDKGRPEGLYADFTQEAYLAALQTLRGHDPKVNKTGVRDLVAGNIQTALYQKWRKIIGATGMGSVRANADLVKLSKVGQALEQKLGRAPTDEELAEGITKTVAEVKRLKQLAVTLAVDYLDRKAHPDSDDGEAFGNLLHANRPGPDSLLEEMDMHDRLEGHMRDAISKLTSPEARLVLAHELGYHDLIDKASKDVRDKHHLDSLAHDSMKLQANHAKLMAGVKGKGKNVTLTPEQIVQGLGKHPAFTNKNPRIRQALVENLMAHGYDPHAMLTQNLQEDEEGKQLYGTRTGYGMVRNLIAQRLGYERSYGSKWVKDAMGELSRHAGLAKFRDEDLAKSWTNQYDTDPLLALYREVFGMPALVAVPIAQRITEFQAPDSFQKAMADFDNVWTVTFEDGFSYQMVVEDLPDATDLLKSWGTALEKQHPDGRWVTIHGVHVFIDHSGRIIAGPHAFVGKHADELQGHLEAQHGKADKKGNVTVDPADTAHHNAAHSHLEDAMKYSSKEHVIHANGKTLKLKVQGKYLGMEKKKTGAAKGERKQGGANTTIAMLHAHDPETGTEFKDPRAALRHLGIDTYVPEAGVNESAPKYLKQLMEDLQHDPKAAEKMAEAFQGRIRAGWEKRGGKSTLESKKTKAEKAAEAKAAERAQFRHNPEMSSDTHKTYSAIAEDGTVHHIQVNRATGKIEGSPMLEQVVNYDQLAKVSGHREIRTEEDLRRALATTAGLEQTVSLQNGSNTYLLKVRHDGTGNPTIISGNLRGKKLHEVVGKNGSFQAYREPIEHNGRLLYAGWDSKQHRLTALGNWSKERAYEHFGATTDEEKQAIDRKIAAADEKALPPTASAKLNPDGTVRITLPNSGKDLQAAKAIVGMNLSHLEGIHGENLDALRDKLTRARHKDQAATELGEGASEEAIRNRARQLAHQEFDLDNRHRHLALAKTLKKLKDFGIDMPRPHVDEKTEKELGKLRGKLHQAGLGAEKRAEIQDQIQAIEKRLDRTHGFHVNISQVEHLAEHLGAVKLDRDTMNALNAHRQALQDEAERAKKIAAEQGLQYLPGMRSDDATSGYLPTTIRSRLIDPVTGDERGNLYFTRPQEQFIERFAKGGGKLINALGVGNGKTMSSLAAMEAHKKERGENAPKKTLIVVPGKNQAKTWQSDFGKMMQTGEDGRQNHLSKGKDVHPDATYHIITVAMLSKPDSMVTTADGRKVHIMQHLREQGFDSTILDEAHKYTGGANPDKSATRKAIEAWLHGKEHEKLGVGRGNAMGAVIAATGTPMQNHINDIYHLVDLVQPGALGSKKAFEAEYIRRATTGGVATLAEGTENKLGSLLANYMHRSTPEDLRTEQRPPAPRVHQVQIQATHELVTPWRLKRDAKGNTVYGADGKPEIEYHEPISMADMLEKHEQMIRSSGADQMMEGEKVADAKGALAAMQHAMRDLYAIKAPHVENLVRQILRENPHAKIGAFSDSHDGQHMLTEIMERVMGEHRDAEGKATPAAMEHYQKALDNLQGQHDAQRAKHHALIQRLGHQLNRLKTMREAGKDALAQNPKASARMDSLIRNLEIRHGQVQHMGDGDGHYAEALREAMTATKHAMARRDGYKIVSITHDATDEEQEDALEKLRTDGSIKGMVLSAKMASTGINAGHLTHVIDLDGNWNPAEREQMYARAARLTGSVPEAETYQMHVVPPPGQTTNVKGKTVAVRSLDQRKDQAANAKQGIERVISARTRKGPPSGAPKIAKVGKEFGDGRFQQPKKKAAESDTTAKGMDTPWKQGRRSVGVYV